LGIDRAAIILKAESIKEQEPAVPATPFKIDYPDAPLGAEISGIDLAQDMDDATFREIERVFLERSVIWFRGQKLTPEQHVRFSRRFGEVEVPVNRQYSLPAQPEIYIVSNIVKNERNIGNADAGRVWHTDSSYMKVPSRCSLLYALEVPHDDGGKPLGDTLFASMTAAYDALPGEVKGRTHELKGVHNYTQQYERRLAKVKAQGGQREELTQDLKAKVPDVVHPVIRTHPETGRKCVYVNGAFVIGIPGIGGEEGIRLRDYLIEHSTQPRFVYRHQWRVGDLLIWDNCATQHLAIADYALPQQRLMYRTTVKGTSAPY
jgi:taurine dioxygenase